MIAPARARMPHQRWVVACMRMVDRGEAFAAIIGRDNFFHLTPPPHVARIPRLARHLAHGGTVLLTVEPEAGKPLGEVGGEVVCHPSLAPEEYHARLVVVGIEVLDFVPNDPECAGRSMLRARRS